MSNQFETQLLGSILALVLGLSAYAMGIVTEHDYFPEDIAQADEVCHEHSGLLVFVASMGEVVGAECIDGARFYFD